MNIRIHQSDMLRVCETGRQCSGSIKMLTTRPPLLRWMLFIAVIRAVMVASPLFSAFVPDEQYQALEMVAEKVERNSLVTYEWLSPSPLRSPLYVVLLNIITSIPKLLHWHRIVPVVLSAFHTAVVGFACDYLMYRWCVHTLGFDVSEARIGVLLHATTWWSLYASPRCLVNGMEMFFILGFQQSLTCSAMFNVRSAAAAVWWGALAIAMRPTALPLVLLYILLRDRLCPHTHQHKFHVNCGIVSTIAVLSMAVTSVVELLYFGGIRHTFANLLTYNLYCGGAERNGTFSHLWYIVEALPSLLLGYAPLFFYGVCCAFKGKRRCHSLASIACWIIGSLSIMSLSVHKEHRYLAPLIPACVALCIPALRVFKNPRNVFRTLQILIVCHIAVALYLGFVHQSGPNSAVRFIAADVHMGEHGATDDRVHVNRTSPYTRVLWLTPCHTSPSYAMYDSLHASAFEVFGLDCSPPMDWWSVCRANPSDPSIRTMDLTEDSAYYRNKSVIANEKVNKILPTYVVTFADDYPQLEDVFRAHSYELVHKAFHAHFLVDDRHSHFLHVYKKIPQ